MLVLFASDLHGNITLYEQLLYVVRREKPSLVLLGGDLLPKFDEEGNLFLGQKRFIQRQLIGFIKRMRGFRHSMDIGIMLGNDDFQSLREDLSLFQDQGLFDLIDGEDWITSSAWHVIGFNLVPETPFPLKDLERRDLERDQIRHQLTDADRSVRNGYEKIDTQDWFSSRPSISEEIAHLPPICEPERTVFVSHAPPYGTPLDIMLNGEHVGSKAVRSYIEKNKPFISLHGHIHESFYMSGTYTTKLRDTVCFNAGQVHYPILDAVLLDTNNPMFSKKHTADCSPPSKEGLGLLKAPLRR
jgi:Icc-related predicted phosphoesterase